MLRPRSRRHAHRALRPAALRRLLAAALTAAAALAETLASIDDVEGWLSIPQARRLWRAAHDAPGGGLVVEIGSFRGRSTIVLASAVASSVEVVAIDPHAGTDRGPQEIEGYQHQAATDHDVFNANLERAGVRERVRHVRAFSHDALADVEGDIDVLFIDGAHRYGPARDDIVSWGTRVRSGGTMLIHDAFSSVGVTLALLTTTFTGRDFEYVGRDGSLVEFRRTEVGGVRRLRNVLRQAASLPWFARNVAIKVLTVAHLRPVARLLGHDTDEWPY